MDARLGGLRAPQAAVLLLGIWSVGRFAEPVWSADPAAAREITYSKHIAPILNEHCAACHRPGEIGPFSLLTYADAQKRADFIAKITSDRRMPPWKAEPGVARFRDERRLAADEIQLLSEWAAAGAPEGDPKHTPKPREYSAGWQLGEPDMVLKMSEPFEVAAGGNDVYRCFVVPIPIDDDRMVTTVEFRPGNPRVVHHAIMFLDSNGQGRQRDGKDGKPGFPCFGGPGIVPTGGLGAWAPGTMPHPLPDGIAKYVRKGSDLVLQVHYHPSGKAETDQSVVGLYFSKTPTERVVTGVAIVQPELKIPAGAPHCHVRAVSERLPADVHVLGVSPHMHNLGKQITVTAVDPSGRRTATLIAIKDWDFNWQGAYEFERPIRLPKGSRIRVEAVYDNSAENPKNPNTPPKEVKWGEQTNDEMCLVTVRVFTDTVEDLQKIAQMPAYVLAAGIEGGVPGVDFDPDKVKALAAADAATAPSDEPPGAAAAPVAAPPANKPAPKKTAVAGLDAVPPEGVPIPPRIAPLARRWDKDKDGRLSRAEIEALPEVARNGILETLQNDAADGQP
ncbi:MAG: hypothetical protein WD845_13815 [Pirellulales bacterium]